MYKLIPLLYHLTKGFQFERGTISYMITSIMTRPTTISPVSTCCCQIKVIEAIDIAPFQRPKPRTVSVETLSRRSVSKISSRKIALPHSTEKSLIQSKTGTESPANCHCNTVTESSNLPPKSPVPSELSSVSAASSSASSHQACSTHVQARSSNRSEGGNSIDPVDDQMVTATIEVMQGGCLPGDKLPVQISVNHNKPVKKLQGIIITMYREGHIDTHPSIPLGPSRPGKKKQYEDYYPKSRTGLRGLSLSSAGSSCSFRKELSQKIVPLIIDPKSLSALIKTSIQVPENLFPTVSSVPGNMLTFKYFIEVVIDLRGKSAGQDRFLQRLNMTSVDSKYNYNNGVGNNINGFDGISLLPTMPLVLLNTESIRREKGVVCCLFHVVVGTRDSGRSRARQIGKHLFRDIVPFEESRKSDENQTIKAGTEVQILQPFHETTMTRHHHNGSRNSEYNGRDAQGERSVIPQSIPPPNMDDALDEKAQIRRAELRLLPSAPPVFDEQLLSHLPYLHPSAPEAFDDGDYIKLYGHARPNVSTSDGLPASSLETVVLSNVQTYQNGSYVEDDKQELERRRLQMCASSPDDYEDHNVTSVGNQIRLIIEPTAPLLKDEDNFNEHNTNESHLVLQSDDSEVENQNPPLYETRDSISQFSK